MAVKLSSLAVRKRIPWWVSLGGCHLSSSCASNVRIIQEPDQNPMKVDGFEEKIRFLRNNLCPDNLIKILDDTYDLKSALKLFKWASLQKRFRHTADTYFRIILKLGLAGNVEEMEGFCQSMIRDGCVGLEGVFASLIELLVDNCRVSEAIRVFVVMILGSFKPSVGTCNAVLCALVREKRDFRDFVFVYKEMVKAGILPNVDTLNYLLEVLFQTGRIESALNQFRRMNRKGCSPNGRTFMIVIKGLSENDRVDDSIPILNEMLKLRCRPELSFFSCMIPLFCERNRLDDSVRLFKTMREFGYVPDSLVYGELIKSLSQNIRLDEATKILEEITEIGITPDDNVFVDIINGFCEVGKLEEAASFLKINCGFSTSPHNALLKGYHHAGRLFMAINLFRKMVESNIADCESWNFLIRWLCEEGEVKKTYEIIGRMIVSSVGPDSATYSALIIGNCKLQRYEYALALYYRLHAECWVLDCASYSKLIEGLCRVVEVDEAVEIFRYMSENGFSLQSSSFTTLIKTTCDTGKVDQAITLLFLAYNSGTRCTNATYAAVILGLSATGRTRDVLVVLSQMLVWGCPLEREVYCALIQNMSSRGRSKDCRLLFNLMVNEDLVPDPKTMHSLLCCLAKHSQLHLVSASIGKLVSLGEILDSEMYNLLINGLWKEGFRSEACRWLDVMLEKGWVPDASTHTLFVGSSLTSEKDTASDYESHTTQDNVSNILAEGLGET